MATRENMLRVRMNEEEKKQLRQLHERWRVTGMSELVRLLIRLAYKYPDMIEWMIEREE